MAGPAGRDGMNGTQGAPGAPVSYGWFTYVTLVKLAVLISPPITHTGTSGSAGRERTAGTQRPQGRSGIYLSSLVIVAFTGQSSIISSANSFTV